MYEVEIRARLSSLEEYERLEVRFREMNIEDLGKRRLKDTVYGLRGLYSIKETGFCYRIREHGNKIIVDRKGRLLDSWNEETLPFDSKEEAHRHFLNKGLLPYLIIDRVRHEYKSNGIRIALDDVLHLGQFIEVEKSIDDADLAEDAKRDLIKFVSSLGISEDRVEPEPYGWLLTLKLEKDRQLAGRIAKELGITVSQMFNE
jgi:predicted adenylyl cyclase CyaB